ncbi:tRNA pseudouridine(55) synthase TruB [Dehalococcoides mccartyi]|uniref:tRNA pseudouridine synthase B n=1 Tax=Dehalococcoides mccartyi (strain VS) TaxID=311424 RepID=D2BI31_DEHMV|nr:tRNA pseudouridine(55) synthase TruB [Dehalococcoides mccartyi]ACZ61981.1 tRNA pseudouridine synthase B [Dehalococcoides mccartyi VS]
MDGILNINKPFGITSFDVVSKIRRIYSQKRVGHGGTLDPYATGVIPVFLGRSTRLIEYLSSVSKTYLAEIELGTETDSYDSEGEVTSRKPFDRITREMIQTALLDFQGKITQIPPMYSAVKHRGMRLYNLARQGIEVERNPRTAMIYSIKLLDCNLPVLRLRIECGHGTYIRSIAFDLGRKLGCGAYLKSLVREAYGQFNLTKSLSFADLEAAKNEGKLQDILLPPEIAIGHLPRVTLDEKDITRLVNGLEITLEQNDRPEVIAVYNTKNRFAAIIQPESDGSWHPAKVFVNQCLKENAD